MNSSAIRREGFAWLLIALFGLGVFAGCAVTESENVKTQGMWAHFRLEHYPDGTVVAFAVLRVGGELGTIIDLVGDDEMRCNGQKMTEWVEEVTNYHWSRAELAVDPSGIYEFELIRTDEDVVTEVLTDDLPTIIQPLPGDTVHPGDRVAVEWTTTDQGDHVNVFLSGDCIQMISQLDQEDDGAYTLPAVQDRDPNNPASCALTLDLRRRTEGTVNAAFQGGYTEAVRIDTIDLSYEQ